MQTNSEKSLQKLLTIKQVAEILNISKRTIYNQIHRKAKTKFPIKPKRIGTAIRFSLVDVKNYIDSI